MEFQQEVSSIIGATSGLFADPSKLNQKELVNMSASTQIFIKMQSHMTDGLWLVNDARNMVWSDNPHRRTY